MSSLLLTASLMPHAAYASGLQVIVSDAVYSGYPIRPNLSVSYSGITLVQGRDYTTSWRSNINSGTASVHITGKGTYAGQRAVGAFTIRKAEASSIAVANMPAQVKWTGKAIEPKPDVSFNGKSLREGIDYRLEYANNVNASANATLKLVPLRNFSGSKTVRFAIVGGPQPASSTTSTQGDKRVDITRASVSQIGCWYVSGNRAVKPTPKVKLGGSVLKQGRDYTLSYKNNRKPGTAHVTVKGIGKHKGAKSVAFKLVRVPGKLSMSGKRVLILGDSIQSPACGCGTFIATGCRSLHASSISNKAVSGAVLTTRKKDNNLFTQLKKVHSLGSYDYYFIAAGTNDISHGYKLGSRSSVDTSTVCGSINSLIQRITKAHVKSKGYKPSIVVLTPIGRGNKSTSTMRKYRKAIAEAADRYPNVLVVDGAKLASDVEMRNHAFTNDKLHPKRQWATNTVSKRLTKILNQNRDKLYAYQVKK